jgi:hypothetical protein
VHRVLAELGIAGDVLLWNVVPTHPGTSSSNRPPTRAEVAAGRVFADELALGRRVIAVGRVAHAAIGGEHVRHPSHGGAAAFARGLRDLGSPSRVPSATSNPDGCYHCRPAGSCPLLFA